MSSVWTTWCSTETTTTSTTTNVWNMWCINDGGTTTTHTTTVDSTGDQAFWVSWNAENVAGNVIQPSAQELAQRREQQEATRLANLRRHERERKERSAASKKAMELLLANLNEKQKEQFEQHGYFIVEGSKSKRKYRIRRDKERDSLPIANIDVLHAANDNRVNHRLCFHLSDYALPLGDNLLAQKLMLESDEDAAIRIANRHAA